MADSESLTEKTEAYGGRFKTLIEIVLGPFLDASASFQTIEYETFQALPKLILAVVLFVFVMLSAAMIASLYVVGFGNIFIGHGPTFLLAGLVLHIAYTVLSYLVKFCWASSRLAGRPEK